MAKNCRKVREGGQETFSRRALAEQKAMYERLGKSTPKELLRVLRGFQSEAEMERQVVKNELSGPAPKSLKALNRKSQILKEAYHLAVRREVLISGELETGGHEGAVRAAFQGLLQMTQKWKKELDEASFNMMKNIAAHVASAESEGLSKEEREAGAMQALEKFKENREQVESFSAMMEAEYISGSGNIRKIEDLRKERGLKLEKMSENALKMREDLQALAAKSKTPEPLEHALAVVDTFLENARKILDEDNMQKERDRALKERLYRQGLA